MQTHTLETIRSKYKDQILSIANNLGISSLKIFGSIARGEQKASSDIDFLIKANIDTTLITLARLQRELEELLNCKVDIVTEKGLSERLRKIIESEAKLL